MHLHYLYFVVLGFASSSFASSSSSSFSHAAKPPKGDVEIENFFWRPSTNDIVKQLKNTMNQSADPCDNFYNFACGNYGKKSANFEPNKEVVKNIKTIFKEYMNEKMNTIVDSKAVNATNALLKSCLKVDELPTKQELYKKFVQLYANTSTMGLMSLPVHFDVQTSFRTDASNITNTLVVRAPNNQYSSAFENDVEKIIADKVLAKRLIEYNDKLIHIAPSKRREAKAKLSLIEVGGIFNPERVDSLPTLLAADNFYNKLVMLIKETDDEVLRTHSIMKLIHSYDSFTNDGDRNSNDPEEVHSKCERLIMKHFAIVMTTLVALETLPTELRNDVDEVSANIVTSIKETLNRQEWLGDLRKIAIDRVDKIMTWAGLPDQISNYADLDKIYENLDVDGTQDAYTQWTNFLRFKNLDKMRRSNKTKAELLIKYMENEIYQLNAWNMPGSDLLYINVGMLQSPKFNYRFPDYFKYGLIGFVLGHEIGHGLVDNRAPGDYFGPNSSIPQSIMDEFARRADCLVKQFDNDTLTVDGRIYKTNGKRYLDENIADNNGFKVAFQAYQKVMANNKHPKRMLEFDDLTPDQLFFVSTAQHFCMDVTWYSIHSSKFNTHPPDPIRFNGVRNSGDFAKAFKCPVGSKMNPEKKCRLWD